MELITVRLSQLFYTAGGVGCLNPLTLHFFIFKVSILLYLATIFITPDLLAATKSRSKPSYFLFPPTLQKQREMLRHTKEVLKMSVKHIISFYLVFCPCVYSYFVYKHNLAFVRRINRNWYRFRTRPLTL